MNTAFHMLNFLLSVNKILSTVVIILYIRSEARLINVVGAPLATEGGDGGQRRVDACRALEPVG